MGHGTQPKGSDLNPGSANDGGLVGEAQWLLVDLARSPPGDYSCGEQSLLKTCEKSIPIGGITIRVNDNGQVRSLLWTTERGTPAAQEYAFMLDLMPHGEVKRYMEGSANKLLQWNVGVGGVPELQRAHEFARWLHAQLYGRPDNRPRLPVGARLEMLGPCAQ